MSSQAVESPAAQLTSSRRAACARASLSRLFFFWVRLSELVSVSEVCKDGSGLAGPPRTGGIFAAAAATPRGDKAARTTGGSYQKAIYFKEFGIVGDCFPTDMNVVP